MECLRWLWLHFIGGEPFLETMRCACSIHLVVSYDWGEPADSQK